MDNEDLEKFENKKIKIIFKNPEEDDNKNIPGEEIIGILKDVTQNQFTVKGHIYLIERIQSISRTV